MLVNYLPIDLSDIDEEADRFKIDILGQEFTFEVFWNEEEEIFTFNLYKDGELLLTGRKITYGMDMLQPVVSYRLDKVSIVPFDRTGRAKKTGITKDNFMESVVPVIVYE